jgi:hypothetical protein
VETQSTHRIKTGISNVPPIVLSSNKNNNLEKKGKEIMINQQAIEVSFSRLASAMESLAANFERLVLDQEVMALKLNPILIESAAMFNKVQPLFDKALNKLEGE